MIHVDTQLWARVVQSLPTWRAGSRFAPSKPGSVVSTVVEVYLATKTYEALIRELCTRRTVNIAAGGSVDEAGPQVANVRRQNSQLRLFQKLK